MAGGCHSGRANAVTFAPVLSLPGTALFRPLPESTVAARVSPDPPGMTLAPDSKGGKKMDFMEERRLRNELSCCRMMALAARDESERARNRKRAAEIEAELARLLRPLTLREIAGLTRLER